MKTDDAVRLKILNDKKARLMEEYINAEINGKLNKSLFSKTKLETLKNQIDAIDGLINESPTKIEK